MKALLLAALLAVVVTVVWRNSTPDLRSRVMRQSWPYLLAAGAAMLALIFAGWMAVYGPAIKLL